MSLQDSQQISNVKILLKKGMDGNGIVSIEKTGTQDNVDTYTITYADGGKDTFTVTNGKSINSIVKTGTSGLVDTYTITYNDTSTFTFNVTNGKSITNITKTSTSGLVDTYTISFNDGTSSTYTVTNGRGIQSITKTSSSGGVDTYTISYNDNTTSTFTVTNGTVASGVSYNNTSSGLTGDDVQEAIDEIAGKMPVFNIVTLEPNASDPQVHLKTVSVPAGKEMIAGVRIASGASGAFTISSFYNSILDSWVIQANGYGNFNSNTSITAWYLIV